MPNASKALDALGRAQHLQVRLGMRYVEGKARKVCSNKSARLEIKTSLVIYGVFIMGYRVLTHNHVRLCPNLGSPDHLGVVAISKSTVPVPQ